MHSKGTETQFDLDWDDHHAVPQVMFPDLEFLFRRMNEVTVEEVETKEGETILDVGCGRAIDAIELAKKRGKCLGLEPSGRMIDHARERVIESGQEVVLVRGIGERLPFKDGVFDKVICKGALDHFPNPDRAVAEIARVLKPWGKAIITVANFESLSFRLGRRLSRVIDLVYRKDSNDKKVWQVPHDHAYKFDYAFLRQVVEPHLKVERSIGISLFFAFPWWGLILARLPRPVALGTLNALDKLARRLPSLSDCMVFKCTPRSDALQTSASAQYRVKSLPGQHD